MLGAVVALLFSFSAEAVTLKPTLDGADKANRFSRYLELSSRVAEIVNSGDFKSQVVAKKFSSTKATGQQAYDALMRGQETLLPNPNQTWDWRVGFYHKRFSRVIGWTNAKTLTVWVNTAKFDTISDAAMMANIAHEYTHKLGFGHSSARDINSVPYAVGYIVRDLWLKKLAEQRTKLAR